MFKQFKKDIKKYGLKIIIIGNILKLILYLFTSYLIYLYMKIIFIKLFM